MPVILSCSLSLCEADVFLPILSGAGFFWTTFFWAGLTAWGLPGIGFLATGLVGIWLFNSAPRQLYRGGVLD
jgi:hypothetical protein